ncbi:MAG TPA: GGDEF domain-containing protein [Mobilitalea sp.]|nr:GGDEF domain-containing protein [Mobilitalea sp.]
MILIVSILKDTYVMAFYDELTGIPSRRALNQDLLKLGMKYSIAMLDIDHFKKFNDTYGHDTGDEVLKFIASMIKDVKGGGKAYRYGGEEFTLLFPGKNMNDVIAPLEELREAIAQREFVIRKKRRAKSTNRKKANSKGRNTRSNTDMKKLHIYVSIGVAQKDDNNKTPAYVIKAADSALYRAKKKGRNCLSK